MWSVAARCEVVSQESNEPSYGSKLTLLLLRRRKIRVGLGFTLGELGHGGAREEVAFYFCLSLSRSFTIGSVRRRTNGESPLAGDREKNGDLINLYTRLLIARTCVSWRREGGGGEGGLERMRGCEGNECYPYPTKRAFVFSLPLVKNWFGGWLEEKEEAKGSSHQQSLALALLFDVHHRAFVDRKKLRP